jgi:restriction system protein
MADLTKVLGKLWAAVTKVDAAPVPSTASPEVKQVETPSKLQPEPEPEFEGDYKQLGYKWKDFERSLKFAEDALNETTYDPYLEVPAQDPYSFVFGRHQQSSSNVLSDDLFVLPQETNPKSLEELLTTNELPQLPSLCPPPPIKLWSNKYPSWYSQYIPRETTERERLVKRAGRLQTKIAEARDAFETKRVLAREQLGATVENAIRGDVEAQAAVLEFVHQRYALPQSLRKQYKVVINREASAALVQLEFPDYASKEMVVGYSGKNRHKEKVASQTQKRKSIRQCLYSCIVRAAYITATLASRFGVQTIVVNVEQNWFDSATGQAKNGVIASLQAPVEYLMGLDLAKLDPEACFKHLKGIATPSLDNASPIRPILVLDKSDDRFVASKPVEQALEGEANLAAIPWEDFEHLVAQLFEWEFAKNGIEVKVTRASRDRGVDAVLFDPDPLRGGKYVLQAKRYTTTVDVSAVRDLFGTVMNEGANRGILISTSSYGPDAYEFAKDKPISLVDGQNLLHMLQKHGKRFRIDLEEARRLNAAENRR